MSYKNAIKSLNKIEKKLENSIMDETVNNIVSISNKSLKICPMDTGKLRKSFRVSINNKDIMEGSMNSGVSIMNRPKGFKRDDVTFELSYDTKYAVVVHYATGDIKWTTPGTGPHYLFSEVYNNKDEVRSNLTRRIRQTVEKG